MHLLKVNTIKAKQIHRNKPIKFFSLNILACFPNKQSNNSYIYLTLILKKQLCPLPRKNLIALNRK